MSVSEEIPEATVNGKASYEAQELRKAYISCKEKLANKDLDLVERQALEFYVEQLKNIHPCADENKFRKPGKGIGGSGDTEVIKPYVVRDRKTKKTLVKSNGQLVVIDCIFSDIARYLNTITTGRAESLRRVDGVRPLHFSDNKYAEADPYAYAFKAVKDYGE